MMKTVKEPSLQDSRPIFLLQTPRPVKVGKKPLETFKKFFGFELDPLLQESFTFDIFLSFWVINQKTSEEFFVLRCFIVPTPKNIEDFDLGSCNIICENLRLTNLTELRDLILSLKTVFSLEEISVLLFEGRKLRDAKEYEKIIKEWRKLNPC